MEGHNNESASTPGSHENVDSVVDIPDHASMKIAFWGNFGTLNLGNESTLAAVLANFRERLPQAEFHVVCRDTEDVGQRHGVRTIPMNARYDTARQSRWRLIRLALLVWRELGEWLRAARVILGLKAVLVVGSGIISDEDEGTLGLPYQLYKWSLLTRLCGKKLFFVSVGAETIGQRVGRAFLFRALRLGNYRSFRDSHSVQYLHSLGFRSVGDLVRVDMAFSLPQSYRTGPRGPEASAASQRVAVGVFHYRNRGQGGEANAKAYAAYLDCLCTLILWLLGRGYAVRIVHGDFAYDEAVRDDVQAMLLQRGLNPQSTNFRNEPVGSFQQLIEYLHATDFVIASRYHNIILGLMLGKPALSLSYEGKHQAVMNEVGLGEFCQSIDRPDAALLQAQFERLANEADSLRGPIASKVAEFELLLHQQYDYIAGVLTRA